MAKPRYPSEKLDQYMLRLPDGMRDRIKAAAEANNRSMNAEIVAALSRAFSDADAPRTQNVNWHAPDPMSDEEGSAFIQDMANLFKKYGFQRGDPSKD